MDFAALTSQLAHRVGLESLAPDSDGRVQLTFDGPLVVDIERLPDNKGYVLVGRLGPGASMAGADHHRKLLEANLLGRLSSASYFALDPVSSQVVLCCRHQGEADYQVFEAELEAFLDELDEMRHSLAQARPGEAAGPIAENAIRA